MANNFGRATTVAEVSGEYWTAVTLTSADVTFSGAPPRKIYVGGTGDLVATGSNSTACTFKNIASGTTLAISPVTIASTNTTATEIIAIW